MTITNNDDDYLEHYGTLRKSGRYPWGSGGTPLQNHHRFIDHVQLLKNQGMSEPDIARGFGISTTQLRAMKSIAKNEIKAADIAMAVRLKDKGMANTKIAERMGKNESTIRFLLSDSQKEKVDILQATAQMLREQVEKKTYIDVGKAVELYPSLGISKEKLGTAVAILQEEGYKIHYLKIPQVGSPGQFTRMKVLSKPGVPYSEVYKNRFEVKQIEDHSEDNGRTWNTLKEPISIDSKRIGINYAEDGGKNADGVIYVRRGVEDVSLGNSSYAQVRIAVDGTHYLKGMAMYKDDLPDGVDLVFNTPKERSKLGPNKLAAMKPMEADKNGNIDPVNPFGASINRQIGDRDEAGNVTRLTSAMNIVNDQGSWDSWSRNLSSQFLSKQSPTLAQTQLDMTFEKKKNELDSIMALTNPTIRKKLLETFAEEADSSAVHLKAHALPRQSSHVILPVSAIKKTEIYAPNFNNGDRVVLVRHPHGGPFEIPELVVNNRNREAKKLLGDSPDAVGIHHEVAARLSGADFDGDSVIVIPNNSNKVKSAPPLPGLANFDAQARYPKYEGMKPMDGPTKQREMGVVSNLITDMTIGGANNNELAAAVRHSMVVIDAEKHELNWKQSAIDNNISTLKAKYQEGPQGGASTLISRANSKPRIPKRKPRPMSEGGPVDPLTGEKRFVPTGETFVNRKTGKVELSIQKVPRLALTNDAHTLVSKNKTVMEEVYATHSNKLKGLANNARREALNTKPLVWNDEAKRTYKEEVDQLNSALRLALMNHPLERQAQLVANRIVKAKRDANPHFDDDDMKKVRARALVEARSRVGADKQRIDISDRQWEAIQRGAISNHKLSQILQHADLDRVKELATPRTKLLMTSTKTARAQQMLASGYTQAEVAAQLGVSLTTLKNNLKGGE